MITFFKLITGDEIIGEYENGIIKKPLRLVIEDTINGTVMFFIEIIPYNKIEELEIDEKSIIFKHQITSDTLLSQYENFGKEKQEVNFGETVH